MKKLLLSIALVAIINPLWSSSVIIDDSTQSLWTYQTVKAGILDLGFGPNGTGKLTTTIGTDSDLAQAIIIQADNKIVVAGSSRDGNKDFALVRYNTDGSLDTTFGSGGTGKVTTTIGSGDDIARALALQTDGKIVAAGYSSNGVNKDFALVRYNTDGSLDTTFGSGGTGKVTTAIGSGDDYGYGVAIQIDGKIIVAGMSNNGSNNDFALVRYNTDGSLDTTFGSGGTGKVTTTIGSDEDVLQGVALQIDGKIVAAGYSSNGSNNDFALVRYNTDGSLDTAFGAGGTGKVTTAIGSGDDYGYGVAIQIDGKIIVAGSSHNGSNNDFALVRYNTDGSLDTTFGSGGTGKVTTAIGSGHEYIYTLTLQIDGKIIAAGATFNGTHNDIALARYNTDGSLDTAFGSNNTGKITVTVGSDDNFAYGIALQFDGKIVLTGYYNNDEGDADIILVRYTNNINPLTLIAANYPHSGLI